MSLRQSVQLWFFSGVFEKQLKLDGQALFSRTQMSSGPVAVYGSDQDRNNRYTKVFRNPHSMSASPPKDGGSSRGDEHPDLIFDVTRPRGVHFHDLRLCEIPVFFDAVKCFEKVVEVLIDVFERSAPASTLPGPTA